MPSSTASFVRWFTWSSRLDITIGNEQHELRQFIDKVCCHFKCRDLEQLLYFLRLEMDIQSDKTIVMQKKYSLNLLQHFNLQHHKAAATPNALGQQLSLSKGKLLEDPTPYHRLVKALQYLTISWPDLAFSINHVCKFMHAPIDSHLINCRQEGTLLCQRDNWGRIDFSSIDFHSSLHLIDSNWVDDQDDRKSMTKYRAITNVTTKLDGFVAYFATSMSPSHRHLWYTLTVSPLYLWQVIPSCKLSWDALK